MMVCVFGLLRGQISAHVFREIVELIEYLFASMGCRMLTLAGDGNPALHEEGHKEQAQQDSWGSYPSGELYMVSEVLGRQKRCERGPESSG
jgi:hypothetical protein